MAGGASGVEQAVGRLVGSLCVVTGRDEDAESAMLASWVSQVHCVTTITHDNHPYNTYSLATGTNKHQG